MVCPDGVFHIFFCQLFMLTVLLLGAKYLARKALRSQFRYNVVMPWTVFRASASLPERPKRPFRNSFHPSSLVNSYRLRFAKERCKMSLGCSRLRVIKERISFGRAA